MTGALLFDMDGTLLDTAPEFTHCLNSLLAQEGKPLTTLASLRSWVSFGAKGMVKHGFKLTEQDPVLDSLVSRFLTLYLENIGTLTQFFPGMHDILNVILNKGLPFAIVTNKPSLYTNLLMQRFAPLKEARCVVAGDSLPWHKPDPAPLLYACQQLSVKPEHCWYIGDALSDVQASRSAKIRCAIAHYGYIPPDENAIEWQADHYLTQPADILQLLS
ncbi:MAG: HAD-IA family hydrolase [Proteobacteria bacterium]|nr:HAD-IA family hydrolase [Pseudomonadota bacterium]